jgi:hypothetical protein
MFESKKLRPDTSITGPVQPVIALLIFALFWSFWGITAGILAMAMIFCCYGLLSLSYAIRTGNSWFYVTMVYQFTVVLFAMIAPKIGPYAVEKHQFKPLVLILIIELAILIYIMATKKLKWRGREILELAAQNIEDTSNGFTERPRPLGKIDCNPRELSGFSDYLKAKLIAFPVKETTRLVIVPIAMGEEYKLVLGISSNYADRTWVAFEKDGQVSVYISKKDYLKYKEALSFDQLCESLGELFIRFFEYYQKGEEIRIINEIDKMKIGIFS